MNRSLLSGGTPYEFKTTVVKTLLGRASLDPNQMKNYRPISNHPFLSKILEKVALTQLTKHDFQPSHTHILICLPCWLLCRSSFVNYILTASDANQVSILTLLDLSAVFDTTDLSILLCRLEQYFGVSGLALSWFKSCLSNRFRFVSASGSNSRLGYGVQQGTVLGSILFVLYTQPLSQILFNHLSLIHI